MPFDNDGNKYEGKLIVGRLSLINQSSKYKTLLTGLGIKKPAKRLDVEWKVDEYIVETSVLELTDIRNIPK